MNAAYSPAVTSREAKRNAGTSARWRGRFVVEGEAVAGVADLADALGEAQPLERRRVRRRRGRGAVGAIDRVERVEPEQVLQVGEHQLLVLLLVVQAELDDRPRGAVDLGHARVDVRAILP